MHFFVKLLPIIAFWTVNAVVMPAWAGAGVGGVKSYREWKMERVQTVQGKITSIKMQIESKRNPRQIATGVDPNLAINSNLEAGTSPDIPVEKLERQLRLELYDLEVAKDLSVTDYFVGYLTKVQDKKSAFSEVAGKLSPEEVAELMTAYANSVFGAQASDLPTSATNLSKDPIK